MFFLGCQFENGSSRIGRQNQPSQVIDLCVDARARRQPKKPRRILGHRPEIRHPVTEAVFKQRSSFVEHLLLNLGKRQGLRRCQLFVARACGSNPILDGYFFILKFYRVFLQRLDGFWCLVGDANPRQQLGYLRLLVQILLFEFEELGWHPFSDVCARLAEQVEQRASAAAFDDLKGLRRIIERLPFQSSGSARPGGHQRHFRKGARCFLKHIPGRGEKGRAGFVGTQTARPEVLNAPHRCGVSRQCFGAQLLLFLFLLLRCGLQPETSPEPPLGRPHQIETFFFLGLLCGIIITVDGILKTALLERDITDIGARSDAESARLSEIANAWQIALGCRQSVIKMFFRTLKIASAVVNSPKPDLMSCV